MKTILLFFTFSVGLFSENLPTLFVHAVPEVPADVSLRIQGGISQYVMRNYSNRYDVIDRGTARAIMNSLQRGTMLDCQSVSCEKDLDLRLSPSFKIKAFLNKGEEQSSLKLELYRSGDSGFELERSVSQDFPSEELQGWVVSLTRSLLEGTEVETPNGEDFRSLGYAEGTTKDPNLEEEQKLDKLYIEQEYEKAIAGYKALLRKLEAEDSSETLAQRERIERKISQAEREAPQFTRNHVKLLCENVKRQNTRFNLAKKKNREFAKKESALSIQESLSRAEEVAKKSPYSEPSNISVYNDTLKETSPEALSYNRQDSKFKEIELSSSMRRRAIFRSMVFPGAGQNYLRPDATKSKVLFYSGIGLLSLSAVLGIRMKAEEQKYNRYTGNLFAASGLDSPFQEGFLFLDYLSFQNLRSSVMRANRDLNLSLNLFGALWLYSMVDIIFMTSKSKRVSFEPKVWDIEFGITRANVGQWNENVFTTRIEYNF